MDNDEIFEIETKIAEIDKQLDELDAKAESVTSDTEWQKLYNESKALKLKKKEYIKELKNIENSSREKTTFEKQPLGLRIHFILCCVFYFPLISWSTMPLWKTQVGIFWGWFGNGISSIKNSFFYYLFFGMIWFFVSIVGLVVSGVMLKLAKKAENKKAFFIYWGIALFLVLCLLTYQILQLVVLS